MAVQHMSASFKPRTQFDAHPCRANANRSWTQTRNILLSIALLLLASCAQLPAPAPPPATESLVEPTAAQRDAATRAGVDAKDLARYLAKPLYRMSPEEVGRYLSYLRELEPDLRERVAHLARKNIGQPYEIYLLGEFPRETVDAQPLFSLEKSDCVVFAEHTYAMALSQSWPEFFWMLQRIRYRDGVIGVATRNHYTETDWNRENRWLVRDITTELGGDRTLTYALTVDRARFFKTRYQLDQPVPVEKTTETFFDKKLVADIAGQLRQGDLVNIVSTRHGAHWVSHVGLVVIGPNGARHILHSAEPAVREETFDAFIARAEEREARNAAAGKPGQLLAGFKFLRLIDHPDVPPMAPQPRPRGR